MPAKVDDDWSDSDDEQDLAEVETSVLLGIPDGPITTPADTADAAVSRLGGHPAFLPAREPPLSSAQCKNCSFPMELLVQLWCPFEHSPYDRALYVWACARSACQKKDGSVRAWRGLRYNEAYAAKLAAMRARELERDKARKAEEARLAALKSAQRANPFAMGAGAGAQGLFGAGLGTQLFGGATEPAAPSDGAPAALGDAPPDSEDSASEPHDDDDSEDELVTAMASSTLADSPWLAAPAYAPLYLSTTGEYLPPAPKPALPAGAQVLDPDDKHRDGEGKGGAGWALEGYENSLEVDHVFERFAQRVACEGAQCVRYDLGGTPLPYAHDAVFTRLFPLPPPALLPVTRAGSKVVPPVRRTYDARAVGPCTACGAARLFECQLMPNLINVLSASSAAETAPTSDKKKEQGDEEARRREVERVLKGGAPEGRGMEWGTCFVFSCEKNCCEGEGRDGKDGWFEEMVLVQWDE